MKTFQCSSCLYEQELDSELELYNKLILYILILHSHNYCNLKQIHLFVCYKAHC